MDLTKKIIALGAAIIISTPISLDAHCGKKHYTTNTNKDNIKIEEKYKIKSIKNEKKYKIKESLHEKLNRQLIFCSDYQISNYC